MFLKKLIESAKQQTKKGIPQHNIIHWFSNELWANGIQINMDVTQSLNVNPKKINMVKASVDTCPTNDVELKTVFEKQKSDDRHTDMVKAAAEEEPKDKFDAAYIKAAKSALADIVPPPPGINKKKTICNQPTKIQIYIYRNYDGSYRMSFDAGKSVDSTYDNLECLNDQSLVTRLILCDNKKEKKNIRIWNECQGIVIDPINWKIIAIPNNTLLYHPSQKIVDPRLKSKDYHLMPIIDGTTVTLYYCKHNGWSLASRRGYDVSTFKWSGPKTYSELFFELLNRFHPNIIEASEMSLSDGKKLIIKTNNCFSSDMCYTFLFRHHDFHPLKRDDEGIWFVQNVNLMTFQKSYQTGLGIQCQPYIPYDDKTTLSSLRKNKTGYGFILRCKENEPGPDILIESTLMTNIRKIIYNVNTSYVEPEDRFLYVSIRAYLGGPVIFSNFSSYFPETNNLIRQLSNLIQEQIKQISTLILSKKNIVINNDDHSLISEIIRFLMKNNLLSSIREVKNNTKILKDIVMDTQFTSHVLKCYKESLKSDN